MPKPQSFNDQQVAKMAVDNKWHGISARYAPGPATTAMPFGGMTPEQLGNRRVAQVLRLASVVRGQDRG